MKPYWRQRRRGFSHACNVWIILLRVNVSERFPPVRNVSEIYLPFMRVTCQKWGSLRACSVSVIAPLLLAGGDLRGPGGVLAKNI